MTTYTLPIKHCTPYNDTPYYEVCFKNIAGRGATPEKAMGSLLDAIKRMQFETGIEFNFGLSLNDKECVIEIPTEQSFYLL